MRQYLGAFSGAVLLASCAAMPPASPIRLEHCLDLYTLWARYGQHPTFHHTGQRARAELALEACKGGRYEAGIEELTELLVRNRISIPAADFGPSE